MRVAMRRAAHQIVDQPKVLDDPLAMRIIGAEAAAAISSGTADQGKSYSRYLRAFLVARSRFAEDELARAVANGVRQFVLLGAGLDTFAYRNPHAGLKVFEVDHPATQAWKRECLRRAEIEIPKGVVFVPVDFERETLTECLGRAGFKTDEKAFFAWLGVVPYLTESAFAGTMKFIAGMPRGSGVVFDYAVRKSELSLMERIALKALSARVAAAGEPFRLFFSSSQLTARLRAMRFERVEDLGAAEINARFFRERADNLRVKGGLGRMVSAET